MYKTKRGVYEEDFRSELLEGGRWHVSYGTSRQADAKPLSDAATRLVRERKSALIALIRARKRTIHEVAACIAEGRSLDSLTVVTEPALGIAAWPALSEAADAYVAALEESEKKSDNTARQARVQLDRFIEYAGGDTRVDRIDAELVTAYQKQLRAAGAAQNTIVAYVWRVSGLYTWLVKREEKDARKQGREPRTLYVPIDADEVASRQTRRDRWLTEEEANRMVDGTPQQHRAAVLLGLLAGLRVHEMLHLRPNYDVDLKLGLITIQEQPTWHPKNRKRRVVPMAAELKTALADHLKVYASDAWLFPSDVIESQPIDSTTFYKEFRWIVENAELVYGRKDPRGVIYHTLRHTFASWLVMRGADLYVVSQLLGNTMAIVEKTYAHLAPDYRQRAVDRLAGVVAIPRLPTEND